MGWGQIRGREQLEVAVRMRRWCASCTVCVIGGHVCVCMCQHCTCVPKGGFMTMGWTNGAVPLSGRATNPQHVIAWK